MYKVGVNQFGVPMINVFRLIASTACALTAIAQAFVDYSKAAANQEK